MNTDRARVVEIFQSIDGEGSRSGYLAVFIRLWGCNLACSFCDTVWAQGGEVNYNAMTFEEILNEVAKYKTKRITLTGGEPLMTQAGWKLADILANNDYDVNIETNGSIALITNKHRKIFYTVDYKCSGSGMKDKMVLKNFEILSNRDIVKFVVGSALDLFEMRTVVEKFKFEERGVEVYVSPVFGKIEPVEIVEYMKTYNMNNVRMQIQLHKILWPADMRGV